VCAEQHHHPRTRFFSARGRGEGPPRAPLRPAAGCSDGQGPRAAPNRSAADCNPGLGPIRCRAVPCARPPRARLIGSAPRTAQPTPLRGVGCGDAAGRARARGPPHRRIRHLGGGWAGPCAARSQSAAREGDAHTARHDSEWARGPDCNLPRCDWARRAAPDRRCSPLPGGGGPAGGPPHAHGQKRSAFSDGDAALHTRSLVASMSACFAINARFPRPPQQLGR